MAVILSESFETDGNGTRYTTSTQEFTDGTADFFTRTDGSDITGTYEVTGADGSFFFGAQDLDGEGADPEQTLTISGIDISGFTNLSFSGLFAEDDSSDGNEDWDNGGSGDDNFALVEYQIDGGGFQTLIAIESLAAQGDFNGAPAVDTNADGTGDTPEITDTFQTLTATIAETGAALDLRLTLNLEDGDEDLAVDLLEISGDAVTQPADTLISEFQPNPEGTDPATMSVEISGTPGDPFSGVILAIESDPGTANPGDINNFEAVSGTFDASGLLTVSINDIENPSFTLVLLDSFSGDTSTDIDTDDDGTAEDLSTFGTVLDAIGVPDTASDEGLLYGAQLGGTDFAFTGDEPGLIFRDASVGDLYALNEPDNGEVFDVNAVDVTPGVFDVAPTLAGTFGAINPSVTGTPAPTLSIDDVTVSEGDAGTSLATFTVTLSGASSDPFTVDFATSDDTAEAGTDYVAALGGLNFAGNDGETQTIEVTINGDPDPELDETFLVDLSNVVPISGMPGVVIDDAQGVGTIQNDDGAAVTLISAVQGSGAVSPLVGQTVTIEGIVVGDFQDGTGADGDLNGFYLQEEDSDADADSTTSEGIFVFDGSSPAVDVAKGQKVQVTGEVAEFFGETQLTNVTVSITDAGDNSADATASTITFPVANTVTNSDGALIADLEAFEGMLVTIPEELTVSDLFTLGRFGDVGLHADGRLAPFTQTNAPSVSGFQAFQDLAVRNTVILDDGSTVQNPAVVPFDVASAPGDTPGELDANDELRSGDTLGDLTGVVRFSRGSGGSGDEIYRINPTEAPVFQNDNPRPTNAPDVGGDITVASFNVLNFFTSIDDEQSRNSNPLNAGPTPLEPRGANDLTNAQTSVAPSTQAQTDPLAEFNRQLDKLIAAVTEIGADIFGLIEIENEFPGFVDASNEGGQTAVERLIDELNSAITTADYQFAAPSNGQLFGDSGDAISVGLVYDANTVEIAQNTTVEILDDSLLPGLGLGSLPAVFDGASTSRAPIAATFTELESGEDFTVAVNHFKSKGSPGTAPTGDVDIGDGVGNANQTRVNAATALDAWLDTDPTGSGDEDFLIIGDLNAYPQEDPIQLLLGEGYTDLAAQFIGSDAYSFGFPLDLNTSPQVQGFGTLDYGLANSSLLSQVTGAGEWHINADESVIFDYNLEFKPQAQADGLFGANPFRASDHDPLIIGLDLQSDAPNAAPVITSDGGGDTAQVNVAENTTAVTDVQTSDDADSEGSGLLYSLTGGADQALFNLDQATGVLSFSAAPDFEAPGDDNDDNNYEVQVTVTDSGGLTDVQDLTVSVTDVDEGGGSSDIVVELIDAITDTPIATLEDGTVVPLSDIEGKRVTIAATVPAGSPFFGGVESMVLDLNDGQAVRTENVEPYALFGDNQGGTNFFPGPLSFTLPVGANSIDFDLFAQNKAQSFLETISVDFTILDDISGGNTPPVAVDDTATSQGSSTVIDVLDNDFDPDAGDQISIQSFTQPVGGSVSEAGDSLVFVPDQIPFQGQTSFEYTIADLDGATSTATVTVNGDSTGGSVTALASIDGEQKNQGVVDTVQAGRDNDLEIGNGDTSGLLFDDVAIADGAQVSNAFITATAQRKQNNIDKAFEIGLFDGSEGVGLSGAGALTTGFDFFSTETVSGSFAKNDDVVFDVTDTVIAFLADEQAANGDETYDMLFSLATDDGIFRINPEEAGNTLAAELTIEFV